MSNNYKRYVHSIKPDAKYKCVIEGVHVIQLPGAHNPSRCIGQGENERKAWKDASFVVMLNKPAKEIESL